MRPPVRWTNQVGRSRVVRAARLNDRSRKRDSPRERPTGLAEHESPIVSENCAKVVLKVLRVRAVALEPHTVLDLSGRERVLRLEASAIRELFEGGLARGYRHLLSDERKCRLRSPMGLLHLADVLVEQIPSVFAKFAQPRLRTSEQLPEASSRRCVEDRESSRASQCSGEQYLQPSRQTAIAARDGNCALERAVGEGTADDERAGAEDGALDHHALAPRELNREAQHLVLDHQCTHRSQILVLGQDAVGSHGVWLTIAPGNRPAAALSMGSVVRLLEDEGAAAEAGLPPPAGSVGTLVTDDLSALRGLLRRAFAVSRALPDQPLREFKSRTGDLPRSTEAERLVIQRVGQDIFRERLLDYWQGRCAVTGLAIPELLRASHIKPWSACEADAERLDVFNGLLLAPHLDAAFDQGFLTVAVTGELVVSDALASDARRILGLGDALRVAGMSAAHEAYLRWHRERVFRG